MQTIYNEAHDKHFPKGEIYGGELIRPFECPERVDFILDRMKAVGFPVPRAPDAFGLGPVLEIHDRAYLEFLRTCYAQWKAEGFDGDAIATMWPSRSTGARIPDYVDGKLGYYALAAESAIAEGTWEAATASADIALTAQRIVSGGAGSAFALCRPPGHHATKDQFGGYCYINNAAIAAQAFRRDSADRVAILDVDFHHGNGTQAIFYDRPDVLFCSLHGEPQQAFPYFLGYADETGTGSGEGFNANYPLPPGTSFDVWGSALRDALGRVRDFGADALVVSLGVDTFEKDPICFFKLVSDDYLTYGAQIAALRLPTLFVMEGGYAVEEVGVNAVGVLQGFLDAA